MRIVPYSFECKNEECDKKLRWRVPVENPSDNYEPQGQKCNSCGKETKPSTLSDKISTKETLSATEILNKITPVNQKKLTRQFIRELKPDNFDDLEKIVTAVISKAIEVENSSNIYAKLCKNCYINWDKDDNFAFYCNEGGTYEPITRREARERKIKPKGFREILLRKSQEQWKHGNGHGNVKFIGELYMEGLLSLNIIKICCQQLVYSDSEYELEALCKLIPTIGKRMLTGPQVPGRANQAQFAQIELDKKKGAEILTIVFGKIEKIVSDGKTLGNSPEKITPRVLCLLQDVIDTRRRNWEQRATAMKGPAKIGDLHDQNRKKAEENTRGVEREYNKAQYERSQLNNERRQHLNQGDWVKQSHVTKSKFDACKLYK